MRKFLTILFMTLLAYAAGYDVGWAETETISFSGTSNVNMSDNTNYASSLGLNEDNWSVVATKQSANVPALNANSKEIRLYWNANGSNYLTVTSLDDYTISSIAVKYSNSSYTNAYVSVGGSNVTGSETEDLVYTYTIDGSSFVIGNANTSNVQVRIKSITITYSSGSTPQPTTYPITRTISTNGTADDATGGWLGNWAVKSGTTGYVHDDYQEGISGATDYDVVAGVGTQVQFQAGTNNTYEIVVPANISITSGGNPVNFTTEAATTGGGYIVTFTMPAAPVAISANFTTYISNLYILGTANENDWAGNVGVAMTKPASASGNYSARVYFKGANGYFSFATALGSDANTYPADANRFNPASNNYDLANNYTATISSSNASSNSLMLPAGIYDINVNAAKTQVTVAPVTITVPTLSVAAGDVDQNSSVSVTAGNLSALLAEIVSGTSATTELSTDGSTYTAGSSYTFATPGNVTVSARDSYGNIHSPVASAAYNVKKENTSNVYELVTNASQLEDNGKYIIMSAASGSGYAMSTEQKSNNRNQSASYEIENSKVTIGSDVQVITLVRSNSSWLLLAKGSHNTNSEETYDGYLYAASSTSNNLKTETTASANAYATIGIDENYKASITFSQSTNRNNMRYNSSYSLFSCYATSTEQSDIYLFKQVAEEEKAFKIIYAPGTNGSVSGPDGANAEETVTVTVTANEGYEPSGVTVTTDDNNHTTLEVTKVDDTHYSFTMPASNVTVTATFTEKQQANVYFEKVTSTTDLEDGEYLIVYKDGSVAFDGSRANTEDEKLDAANNTIAVTIDGNEIEATPEALAAVFTITTANGSSTIKSASGFYIGRTTNSNGLDANETTTYAHTITFDGDGNADIACNLENNKTISLRFNAASNQNRFRYHTNYSQQAIQLYKLVEKALPLAKLLTKGHTGETYTITNQLVGVYAKGNTLWAKDEAASIDANAKPDGYSDFLLDEAFTGKAKTELNSKGITVPETYSQNNWIALVMPEGTSADSYKGVYLPESTVTGVLTNDENYELSLTKAPGEPVNTKAYTKNVYTPANFVSTYWRENTDQIYFVKPKVQEVANIAWAVWNGTSFVMPENCPAGSFTPDFTLNEDPAPTLETGKAYAFMAVIENGGSPSGIRRLKSGDSQATFNIKPLNLTSTSPVTGISNVGGSVKEVKSVRVYNVAGVEQRELQTGVNIVVTTYTDGTRTTAKVLK